MRKLLIDDMRNIQDARVARTYADGIAALKNEGPWDTLYLDHDLGEEIPSHTGYGIMCWLEANPEYLPGEIILVTSNPVGRSKMQVVINRLYEEDECEF